MNFPEAVKELRQKALLTQTELARKLSVAYATVNRWENGHHEPTMGDKRKIRALCRRYGIEI